MDLVDGELRNGVGDVDAYMAALRLDPCAYCSAHVSKGHSALDHIVPAARGGSNGWHNKTHACSDCNSYKSSMSLLSFLATERQPFCLPIEVAIADIGRLAGDHIGEIWEAVWRRGWREIG